MRRSGGQAAECRVTSVGVKTRRSASASCSTCCGDRRRCRVAPTSSVSAYPGDKAKAGTRVRVAEGGGGVRTLRPVTTVSYVLCSACRVAIVVAGRRLPRRGLTTPAVVLRGPLCARRPPRGRRRRRGTRSPTGGGDASGGGGRRGGNAGAGKMGPSRCPARATRGAYLTGRATAHGPRGRPDWRAREGAGAPGRARQATADRAPRGGCSALRVGWFLPLVCNDRLGGLDMHGGNYLHWLVTARVNSHLGKLGPGDG